MDRTIRKGFSIIMIMLMIMPFTWITFADDDTASEPEGNVSQTTEAEAHESAAAQDEQAQAVSEAAEAPAEEIQSEAETAEAASGKTISIAGTSLDGSSNGSGSGWSYDSSNNTIVLSGLNEKTDIITDGTGATIVATGLNRIGTLSCDGQLDVIGTGIVLIDKIELAEGSDFNLHSIAEFYGEDGGSAAVFLRQKDGSYMLINGSVTGVIDDKITLPEGTTLVMPENSSLKITSLTVGITYDEDGEPICRYLNAESNERWESSYKPTNVDEYKGKITVDNLVLKKGAVITQLLDGLKVVKNLVNDGTIISAFKGCDVDIDGNYSGSGVIEGAKINISKGQKMSINIKDSNLNLTGSCVINKLTITGDSALCYLEDTTIKKIKVTKGDRLRIYNMKHLGEYGKLNLTGSADSGEVYFGSGLIEIGKKFKLLNGASLSNSGSGAVVIDYSGKGSVSSGLDGSVFIGPKDITVPDQKEVPVVAFEYRGYNTTDVHIISYENEDGEEYIMLDPFDAADAGADGTVSYDELSEKYGEEFAVFEVFSLNKGVLSMTELRSSETSVPAGNIVMIRRAHPIFATHTEPGVSITNTLSSRTGSGTIGGNANSILTGSGIKQGSSASDNTNNYRVARAGAAVGAAVRSTIQLIVDIYDLNAGIEDAEEEPYYVLSAFLDGAAVTELGAPAEAIMDYELPEEFRDKQLYAVFAEEDEAADEMLRAYRAEYDEETGRLSFETAQLGEFVIAAIDFDGEEFSPEFYDELEKTEEVQTLIRLLEEKTDNSGL